MNKIETKLLLGIILKNEGLSPLCYLKQREPQEAIKLEASLLKKGMSNKDKKNHKKVRL